MASAKARASSRSGDDVSHHSMSAYGAYARPRAIAAESPPSMRKNPSAVLSPVRNAWSLGSASLVTRRALFASVRATRTVGTRMTCEARRAATSFWMNSPVGTTTLPPRCPHFFAAASWSSKWTPAAPASIIAFVISNAWSDPPKPSCADLLDRVVSGEGPEGLDVVFRPEELPEPFGPELREGVPDRDRTAQPIDVRGPVRPYDARPAFRAPPILFQFRGLSSHSFPSPIPRRERPR